MLTQHHFFIVAYEFTTSFITSFKAPVKTTENPVWYARILVVSSFFFYIFINSSFFQGLMALILYSLLRNPCLTHCFGPQRASSYSMTGHMFDPNQTQAAPNTGTGQYQFHPATLDVGSLKGSRASLLNEVWNMRINLWYSGRGDLLFCGNTLLWWMVACYMVNFYMLSSLLSFCMF